MEFKNPLFFLLLLVLVPYIVWYVMRALHRVVCHAV